MHSLDDGWSRVRHEIKYWKVTEIEVSIIVVIASNIKKHKIMLEK